MSAFRELPAGARQQAHAVHIPSELRTESSFDRLRRVRPLLRRQQSLPLSAAVWRNKSGTAEV